jgi:iron complex outermembrane receptor protein
MRAIALLQINHLIFRGNTSMFSKITVGIVVSILLSALLGTSIASGQTKQLITWRDNLVDIQKASESVLKEQDEGVAHIRAGIELWIKLHRDTEIELKAAPAQPWNSQQIREQVAVLIEAIDAILKEDNGQPFELGMTTINVTAESSRISPVTDSIDNKEMKDFHFTNVSDAIELLPGVAVDHKSNRNQTGIMIRGFDTRQVGIYLDGIPIYIPYDGYSDMSHLLSSDLSLIEIAKGYSSPLLGPNGLGGTVNMVTRQPEKKIEGDAVMGTGSGEMLEAGIHLGSRWDKFFLRGGMDWFETKYYPLSGDFAVNEIQPSYKRVNSSKHDARYNGRLGFTPNEQDQYVFTYTKQKADTSSPPYSGIDLKNNRVDYNTFPYWNRDSYYLNTNTGLGETGSIKFRAFYDKYPNGYNMFKDATLTGMKGFTAYDDYSAGFSSEYTTRKVSRHALSASFFYKEDTHKSQDASFSKSGEMLFEPWLLDRDRLISIGFQDLLTLSSQMRATIGFSVDYLNGLEAQHLDSDGVVVPFECVGAADNSCLADTWALNPLASFSYSVYDSGTLFFTFAMKTHFPTLKDRYSLKKGKAIPNPALKEENAANFTLGYTHAFSFDTMMQIELFRSDVDDAIADSIVPATYPNQCEELSEDLCQQSTNVGKEVHQGVEFTLRTSPMQHFSFTTNYTYLHRTITGPENMPPIFGSGTPKNKLVATAGYQLPRNCQLLAALRYEGGAVETNRAGEPVAASKFAKVDFGGVIPIYSGAVLRAGVKNLFDKNYYYKEGYPEPGRNWYVNMRYQF